MPIIIVKEARQKGKTEAAIDFFIKNKENTTYFVHTHAHTKTIKDRILKKIKKTEKECPELDKVISIRSGFKTPSDSKYFIFDEITCMRNWNTIWAAYYPLSSDSTFIIFLTDIPENLNCYSKISIKEFKEVNLGFTSWQKGFKNYLKKRNG